jgi:hypothetical protein
MAKKTSRTAERIKKQREKVLEHLSESGNVSYACKRTGVSRETYYRWRADDEGFLVQTENAVSQGKAFVNDLAHTKLMQSIQEGYFPAVRFQLVNCHDDYHPKKTTSPYRIEEQTPLITIASIPAMAKLQKYREYLEGGGNPND